MFVNRLFKHWTYQIFSPGTVLREKYEAFKRLLDQDRRAHELIAELEEIFYRWQKFDLAAIARRYDELAGAVGSMIDCLQAMAPGSYLSLSDYFKKIDFYIRFMLAPPELDFAPPFVVGLDAVSFRDDGMVGGKAFNLARLKNRLKLPVPPGFVITTMACNYFLECNDLRGEIDRRLAGLDPAAPGALERVSKEIVATVLNARLPTDIEEAIAGALAILEDDRDGAPRFAVRSSAVAEDGEISFAGQYQTMLNVVPADLARAWKEVVAGKYSPRALFYRISYGLLDAEIPMAVLVLPMIDAVASGVVTTVDLENDDDSVLVIHSLWGLGELLVGGESAADAISCAKDEPYEVIRRRVAAKSVRMGGGPPGRSQLAEVAAADRHRISLADHQARTLAGLCRRAEDSWGRPLDIEWCLDRQGRILLLQARPLALAADRRDQDDGRPEMPEISGPVLLAGGERAAPGVGSGLVFLVTPGSDPDAVPAGVVLVCRDTPPTLVKIMDRLEAVVADRGSVAGHFASVAREFGVPVLVNTGEATSCLVHGQPVTVDVDRLKVHEAVSVPRPAPTKRNQARFVDSPYLRKLKYIIDFISPLALVDPQSPSFVPESCRSLHDLIRFTHEKAMSEMFSIGDRRTTGRGSRRLVSRLPLAVHVLDVGGGLLESAGSGPEVSVDDIHSRPFRALWQGLAHPDIDWAGHSHFDWKTFDTVAMAGGVASSESAALATYAVVSEDYLNLNMRFGYHFVIVDTLCGSRTAANYIALRFAGGGGDFSGRSARITFLAEVLGRLGFVVESRGDLLDARVSGLDLSEMEKILDLLGRLLGATRLLDMVFRDSDQVADFVADFFAGRYSFSSSGSRSADGPGDGCDNGGL